VELRRPNTLEEAIKFALFDRNNCGWLWAQYLVDYLEEEIGDGSSIPYTLSIYEALGNCRSGHAMFGVFLEKVRHVCSNGVSHSDCENLHDEIWYSESNDSHACCRGLTRILNAWSLRLGEQTSKFRIEISRAIQMACRDESNALSFQQLELELRKISV